MKEIGTYTKTILKLVKETITGAGNLPSPSSSGRSQPRNVFNPERPVFVVVDNKSVFLFIYGVSEYGGDDLVMYSETPRRKKRYFLTLSGA